jgi:glycosyltransferase involved in cell wall biosynthesis
MKILMVAQFYKPVFGGEERMVEDLSVELVARGYEVSVVTLQQGGHPEREVDRGVRVLRVESSVRRSELLMKDAVRTHALPVPDPRVVRSLRQILETESPDIVHAHNWLGYSYLPLRRQSRSRFVVSLHDHSLVCATKRLMRGRQVCGGPGVRKCLICSTHHYGVKGPPIAIGNAVSAHRLRRAVDLFLPVSESVAELSGLARNHLPYRVIPNFVPDRLGQDGDTARLAELPADYILFVGDLSHDKGIEVLLEAHGGLSDAPPLVLIGRGAQRLDAIGHNVLALEGLPHEQVVRAWQGATFAVAPSIVQEAFCLVALEAMAAGRAVVATRTGGLADLVVDGDTGVLVPPANVTALREALQRLLARPHERERMGDAARKRAEQFRASAVVPLFEQAYRDVLENAEATTPQPAAQTPS